MRKISITYLKKNIQNHYSPNPPNSNIPNSKNAIRMVILRTRDAIRVPLIGLNIFGT